MRHRLRRDWPLLLMVAAGGRCCCGVFHYVPTARQRHRVPGLLAVRRRSADSAVRRLRATSSGCSPNPAFWDAVANTLSITAFQLVFFFPMPIALALLLNSVAVGRGCAAFIQGVVYLPHFFSWVLVVTLFQQMLGGAGLLAQILRDHGLAGGRHDDQPGHVHPAGHRAGGLEGRRLGDDHLPRRAGTIDPDLYEAAAVDGAAGGGGCGTSRCPGCGR